MLLYQTGLPKPCEPLIVSYRENDCGTLNPEKAHIYALTGRLGVGVATPFQSYFSRSWLSVITQSCW